ncbi:hypothetical protein IU485_02380 [Nocardia cyriacigeorgica]|uniref:hypothetical protein n=1 Tax=Nocardia cyriacigeorgica TaxID=135487 RepID=UPI0018931E25|nr:hypothetical protein [Nocardia cyriacigeorgica]MBF6080201.1 hypothetical protein [Nocardia cyriacigeorgica]
MASTAVGGAMIAALAAGAVATAAPAAATPPPPPSPLCTAFSYPAAIAIELTGGHDSPLLPVLNSLQPIFCG